MIKFARFLFLIMAGLLVSYSTPYAAQVTFLPELFLSAEYTDNVFFDNDDDDLTPLIDDIITTVDLRLNLDVLGQTGGMNLIVNPSFNSFADNDNLNYWRYLGELNTWKNFKRNARLGFTSIYLETEDPRDSALDTSDDGGTGGTEIELDPTRRERNRYFTNTNELRFSHQFSARSDYYLALEYNLLREMDVPAGAAPSDHDEILPRFGVEYWFERQWGMVLDTSFSDRSYKDTNRVDRQEYDGSLRFMANISRHLSIFLQYRHTELKFKEESPEDDYQVDAPSLGLEYQLRENTTFRLGAGYYFQDYEVLTDDEAPFVDAEIDQRWLFPTGFIRLVATSGYDIEDTGAEDLGLNVYYQGRLETRYNITSRFLWDFLLSYRHDDYKNSTPRRRDNTSNAETGLSYQVSRWMNFRLAYAYEDVSSDEETVEFTENSVVFTINFTPSSAYRLN